MRGSIDDVFDLATTIFHYNDRSYCSFRHAVRCTQGGVLVIRGRHQSVQNLQVVGIPMS